VSWTDLPDGYRISMMVGQDAAGDPVILQVDAAGRIIAVMKGETALGALKTLRTDADGQIIAILKGAAGNNVAVDASGYLASVMKGANGANLITLAVDASGNIIGVLKGDYAGALKTLAVDSQGRMLAVLTDPEDVFANPHYMGAAELAARLGTQANFDRRGQLLYQDNFAGGLAPYRTSAAGTGAAVTISGDHAYRGGFSCRLLTGNTSGNTSFIQRAMQGPANWHLGAEFSWAIGNVNVIPEVQIVGNKAGTVYTAKARYHYDDGKLQIWVSSAWHDVDSFALAEVTDYWHVMKLVVDFDTGQYIRLLVDDEEFDISDHAIGYSAGTDYKYFYVMIANTVSGNYNRDIYVGHLVITYAEP